MDTRAGVSPDDLNQLLAKWMSGDQEALKALFPFVYAELRRLAHNRLAHQNHDQTFQTTALVHEAYLRLARRPPRSLVDRNHFFALAATVMRQVLVDHARENQAKKRHPGVMLDIEVGEMSQLPRAIDLLALDQALHNLAKLDARQSKIVELRFFAGLSIDDTSEILSMSPATIKREWMTARAWLHRELSTRERQARATGAGGSQ
jgi:RNA polymerase sigma factor (TIGR02999 family)